MKSFRDFFKSRSLSDSVTELVNDAVIEHHQSNPLPPQNGHPATVEGLRNLLRNGELDLAYIRAMELYAQEEQPSLELLLLTVSAARQAKKFEKSLEVAREGFSRFSDDWFMAAEYLQANFNCQQTIDALPLAVKLTEEEPDNAWGWHLRARASELDANFEEASACWEKAVNLDPENGMYVFALLNSLIQGGNTSKAKEIYSAKKHSLNDSEKEERLKHKLLFSIEKNSQLKKIQSGKDAWDDLEALQAEYDLHNARYTYDMMVSSARKLAETAPDRFQSYRPLLHSLFRAGKYQEGLDLCDYLASRFPDRETHLIFIRCQFLEGWGRYGEALTLLEETVHLEDKTAGIANPVLLGQRYKRIGRAEEAYLLIKEAVQAADTNAQHLVQLARFEMAVNRIDAAIRTVQKLRLHVGPEAFETEYAVYASWLAYQMGKMRLARKLMKVHNEREPYHTLFKSTPPVEVKAAETELPQARQVRMFTHVYNEESKIKAFLMHYRRLGVDVFYITDNASDDGTHEFLMEQPDVRLFYSDTAFSDAGFGIWWINHLVQRYGADGWCMHADVDELLVYPNCETIGLGQLTDYMEANGQEVLLSYMLDLYPEKMADVLDWDGSVHPAEVCPYFDDNIHFLPTWVPPYQEVWGGFRARIMGDGHGPGQLSIKTPLFKGSKDFKLLLGTHYCTPVVPSDVTSACLHFKFIGDVQNTYAKTVEHDEHHDSCFTYRQYLSWLDTVGIEDDLRADNTHRFNSSETLRYLGLIKSSVAFEHFCEQQKPTFQADLPRVFILTAPGCSSPEIRQFLRLRGLLGEVESDFPVHTRTDLEDRHGSKQIFVGLAPLHDFEYLYHLIPQSHFILIDSSIVDWEAYLQEYCSKGLETADLNEVQRMYRNKKEFNALPKRQRGIVQSLGKLLEGAYSWQDAARRFNEKVEAFFADKDPERFAVVKDLTHEGLEQELAHLSFLQPPSKPFL